MGFFEEKRVLVTGASGFVGTNLLRRLIAEGARCRAITHTRDLRVDDDRVEHRRGDLTDPRFCAQAVAGVDYVFHCAASTSGAAVIEKTPLVHVTPNVVMNAYLLEAAYAAGVRKFLWLSSSTGYPPTGDRPVREEEMFDGDPYEKYYGVGWMKRYTEVLCRLYGERLARTMTTIVLRPTNIYGEEDDYDFATSHVFAALLRRVVERQDPIAVWGDGEDVRDLIYVQDFVEAMCRAMERLDRYAAINIGLGKGYRVKDILDLLLAADGYAGARVTFDPSKPTMIPVRLVDITRAAQTLDFRPRVDLPEGIARTLRWYREENKG